MGDDCAALGTRFQPMKTVAPERAAKTCLGGFYAKAAWRNDGGGDRRLAHARPERRRGPRRRREDRHDHHALGRRLEPRRRCARRLHAGAETVGPRRRRGRWCEDDTRKPDVAVQIADRDDPVATKVDILTGIIWSNLASRRRAERRARQDIFYLSPERRRRRRSSGKGCHKNYFNVSWQNDNAATRRCGALRQCGRATRKPS